MTVWMTRCASAASVVFLCAATLVGCPEDVAGDGNGATDDGGGSTTGGDVIGGGSDTPTTTGGDDAGGADTGDVDGPTFAVDICVVSDLPGAAACDPVTELDFGAVPVGTSKTIRVRVRNDSTVDVTLDSAEIETPFMNAASFSPDDESIELPETLAPDEAIFVDVTLDAGPPPGDLPASEAVITLTIDSADDARTLTLLGTIVGCLQGTDSCDDDWVTGCETITDTDAANCGGCGLPCAPANATGNCNGGICEITDCDPGFFGPTCSPCPGETAPCTDNGVCADGVGGTGTCTCDTGATGDACETCETGFFGAGCDACPGSGDVGVCTGHGTCDDLVAGAGSCSCDTGWEGDDCATDSDECVADVSLCDANALCTNTDGAFECACNAGWEGDGFTIESLAEATGCTDIDECSTGDFACVIGAGCNNVDGSSECVCLTGFDGDGTTCTPTCDAGFAPTACLVPVDAGGCEQGCKDAVCAISADCCDTEWTDACSSCAAGGPGPDNADCSGVTGTCPMCLDLDECAGEGDGNNCDANAACTNSQGAFGCACNAGYEGDGHACTDIDECATDADDCSDNGTCSNTDGAFACACNDGWAGDGVTCDNVDECADATAGCHANATCTDSDGSFDCTCNAGYSGDGSTAGAGCTNDNECADEGAGNNCANNSLCTDNDGGFDCACDAGFDGSAINICSGTDCLDQTCRDAVAAFDSFCATGWDANCASCAGGGAGFGGVDCADAATSCGGGCIDQDECAGANGGHDCDVNAACSNLPGTFLCTCNDGWLGDGTDGGCVNADECADEGPGNNCGSDALCTDSDGSFACSCDAGYAGDGIAQCQGDDCPAGACLDAVCALDSFCCSNWDSGCASCAAGGLGFGDLDCASAGDTCGGCDDVDECTDATHNCDVNAVCTNTDGAFECACGDGWVGDGTDGTCTDFDECGAETDNCDGNATCNNIDGSFTCACNSGFEGDGTTCVDIDECTTDTHDCDANATCSNVIGSFNCACNDGFDGDG
ncbi:MAG: hypothetical protein ACI9WU_002757, partial [Myxococcota bacterium]